MASSRNLSPSWAKSSLLAPRRDGAPRRGCAWPGSCSPLTALRSDAGRPRIELDRPSGLELFAVEAEDHDLLLDHALDQKRAVALAPGETLTPVADLGLGQRDQLVAFDAQHLHQSVIVKERVVLGLVGPIR